MSEIIVLVYRAQPSLRGEETPTGLLRIMPVIPDMPTLAETDAMQRANADCIVDLLRQTLPQGTWAHVVRAVAEQWAADQHGRISATAWYRPTEA